MQMRPYVQALVAKRSIADIEAVRSSQAVKALRFDPAAHKQKVPETEEARQERVKAEAELAKALEEADEEDGM